MLGVLGGGGGMRVLDVGGADWNGSLRGLGMLPGAEWTVVDLVAGRGVDVVADCTVWRPDGGWDLAVCTEVLEHVEDWRGILACMAAAAGQGIVTCASTGRRPHGAQGAAAPAEGEWYANIGVEEFADGAAEAGLQVVRMEYRRRPGDLYAAVRRRAG